MRMDDANTSHDHVTINVYESYKIIMLHVYQQRLHLHLLLWARERLGAL